MSTVKWLESKIISETQRAKYAEGRVRALLLELDKKDAALRRAKAEGVRLVQKEMEESGNQRLGGWINWCHARAAQIEEGE